MACELYCCLLPQCEALRTCRSGFPIATVPSTSWIYVRPVTFPRLVNSLCQHHICFWLKNALYVFALTPQDTSPSQLVTRPSSTTSPCVAFENEKATNWKDQPTSSKINGERVLRKIKFVTYCVAIWAETSGAWAFGTTTGSVKILFSWYGVFCLWYGDMFRPCEYDV